PLIHVTRHPHLWHVALCGLSASGRGVWSVVGGITRPPLLIASPVLGGSPRGLAGAPSVGLKGQREDPA
ncbi:hypothetical protein NDU88_000293, partial [Pleurodeles waltl]